MRRIFSAIGAVLLELALYLVKTILGLLCLTPFLWLIIGSHELGHYAMMRHFGVPVAEVAVGFGPKILSFTHAGTLWCWRLIPLAGGATLTSKGIVIMGALPLAAQIAICVAGIAVNLLTAVALATFLYWWYRRPALGQLIKYVISAVCKLPLGFMGIAFLLLTAPITFLIPPFRPRLPFGSGLVVLPDRAERNFLRFFIMLALFLGLANLLPLYPLDGGMILDTVVPLLTSSQAVREIIQTIGFYLTLFIVFLLWTGQVREDFKLIRYESRNRGKRVEFTLLTIGGDKGEPRIALLQTENGIIAAELSKVRRNNTSQEPWSVMFTGQIVEDDGKSAEQIHGVMADEADAERLSGWFEIE